MTILSVHLQHFPKLDFIKIDSDITEKMDIVREVCNCVFALRKEANIRVRMPLNKITICGEFNLEENYLDIIKQEVNVHNVEIFSGDTSEIATKDVVLNMKECGKIFDSNLKDILIAQKKGEWKIENDKLVIAGNSIDNELFSIVYKSKNGLRVSKCATKNILVMLDDNITEELQIEGLSRDIVRIIQQTRKDIGLEISDRIDVKITYNDAIFDKVFDVWKQYICNQTLADKLEIIDDADNMKKFEIDKYNIGLMVLKK